MSAALLEVAALAARRLFAQPRLDAGDRAGPPAPRTSASAARCGRACSARSSDPYLRERHAATCCFFTLLTTFLYFQQATIVDAAIVDRTARTRFFANIDLAVNVLTLVTQTVRHRPVRSGAGA